MVKGKEKNKKRIGLRKQYGELFSYLHKTRNYFFMIITIFLISLILGITNPDLLGEEIEKIIESILKQTEGLNTMEMFLFIFSNNLTTSFFGIILGIFFGLFPLIGDFLNGYVLGYVLNKSVGVGGVFIIWKLFPHGIFELPALFISLSLGVNLGMFIFQKQKKRYFIENLEKSLKVFVFIILPLLPIAGIIETLLIFLVK